MKRMLWTHWIDGQSIKEHVCFMSAFYRNGDGVKALFITSDNKWHEDDIQSLELLPQDYNKIFTE